MLEVESLSKRFGTVTALDGVSFSVAEGEIVGLLGENGAGKTTTLGLLSGALFPTSGQVLIGGRDILSDRLATRRRVGYLPEQLPLDPNMRVRPFLHYVARLRGMGRAQRPAAVEGVIESCQLTELAERSVGALSRGGRMRVGLAQALVHNPELLLLDEPTAGLDPGQVLNMRKLILSLAGHHTILFSSHNLTEVSECCSRVVLLREGRVVQEDALANLEGRTGKTVRMFMRFARPSEGLDEELSGFEGVVALTTPEIGGPGVRVVEVDARVGVREALVEAVAARGWGLCEVREQAVTLAEIFHRHQQVPEAEDDTDGIEAHDEKENLTGDEVYPEEAHHEEGHHEESRHGEVRHGEVRHGEGHHGEGHHEEAHHEESRHGEDHHGEGHHGEAHHGEGHHGEGHHEEGHHGEGHHEEGHHEEDHHGEGHHGEGHHEEDHHEEDHHEEDHHE
ncbi:MAG: ABC transporter ATP-binding protein, partial [Leptospirillia bacterium]